MGRAPRPGAPPQADSPLCRPGDRTGPGESGAGRWHPAALCQSRAELAASGSPSACEQAGRGHVGPPLHGKPPQGHPLAPKPAPPVPDNSIEEHLVLRVLDQDGQEIVLQDLGCPQLLPDVPGLVLMAQVPDQVLDALLEGTGPLSPRRPRSPAAPCHSTYPGSRAPGGRRPLPGSPRRCRWPAAHSSSCTSPCSAAGRWGPGAFCGTAVSFTVLGPPPGPLPPVPRYRPASGIPHPFPVPQPIPVPWFPGSGHHGRFPFPGHQPAASPPPDTGVWVGPGPPATPSSPGTSPSAFPPRPDTGAPTGPGPPRSPPARSPPPSRRGGGVTQPPQFPRREAPPRPRASSGNSLAKRPGGSLASPPLPSPPTGRGPAARCPAAPSSRARHPLPRTVALRGLRPRVTLQGMGGSAHARHCPFKCISGWGTAPPPGRCWAVLPLRAREPAAAGGASRQPPRGYRGDAGPARAPVPPPPLLFPSVTPSPPRRRAQPRAVTKIKEQV